MIQPMQASEMLRCYFVEGSLEVPEGQKVLQRTTVGSYAP